MRVTMKVMQEMLDAKDKRIAVLLSEKNILQQQRSEVAQRLMSAEIKLRNAEERNHQQERSLLMAKARMEGLIEGFERAMRVQNREPVANEPMAMIPIRGPMDLRR